MTTIRKMVRRALPQKAYRYARAASMLPRVAINYWYDMSRYLKVSGVWRQQTAHHVRGRLAILSHRLEKGLALPAPRPGFGVGVATDLMSLLEAYLERHGRDRHVDIALSVLKKYLHFQAEHGHGNVTLAARLERLQGQADLHGLGSCAIGGVDVVTRGQLLESARGDFESVVRTRRSVRVFSEEPVPMERILAAVDLARHSPSVCNRQAWRVRAYTDRDKMEAILKLQAGNRGFGETARALLVVSVDQRYFTTPGERNQGWFDGGLFAMLLALGLHRQELGSCFLNWSVEHRTDRALRSAVGLPEGETVVVMLAVGMLPDSIPIARSERLPLDEVLLAS